MIELDPSTYTDAWEKLVTTTAKHIGPSILTCVMFVFLYFSYQVIQTGNLFDAAQVLFTSREARLKVEMDRRATVMQDELKAVAAADKYIHQTMQDVLDQPSGNAVRIRLSTIHNSTNTLNAVGNLHFDISSGLAERGRSVGDMPQNLPLSQWSDYLSDLLMGHCKYEPSAAITDATAKARLDQLGITSFLVCPVRDANGALLGGLFLSWDRENEAEAQVNLAQTTNNLMIAADKIGLVYAARPKSISAMPLIP